MVRHLDTALELEEQGRRRSSLLIEIVLLGMTTLRKCQRSLSHWSRFRSLKSQTPQSLFRFAIESTPRNTTEHQQLKITLWVIPGSWLW